MEEQNKMINVFMGSEDVIYYRSLGDLIKVLHSLLDISYLTMANSDAVAWLKRTKDSIRKIPAITPIDELFVDVAVYVKHYYSYKK